MSNETTPAVERAAQAIGDVTNTSGVLWVDEAAVALAAALDVEEMAKVINEALMGYAPGTFDGVENGAWNARDDEIDVAKVAARLRAALLGGAS